MNNLLKALSLLPLLLLSDCKGSAVSPADVARDACKVALAAEPFVASLIGSWGDTLDAVLTALCSSPLVAKDFQTLPTPEAKSLALSHIRRMASAARPDIDAGE